MGSTLPKNMSNKLGKKYALTSNPSTEREQNSVLDEDALPNMMPRTLMRMWTWMSLATQLLRLDV